MKRPNRFIYGFLNRVARIYTRLAKNHHFRNPSQIKVSSPAIIISNHTSFFDFLYVMWAFKNTPVNFVVARKYFETKPLSSLLKWGQTIPKSLFQADPLSVKQMLEVIKIGGVIGIFPEGQISITGVTLPFPQGIGKFVKKVQVPVYAVKTTGAYLKDPPWTNLKRKGRVESELLLALTSEDINHLTPNEIEDKLYKIIYTNPFWESKHSFHGHNLAKGLENILYLCPKCHSEGQMMSEGNDLICQECGFHYYVQADGWLSFHEGKTNIDEAYQNERNWELQQILKDSNFLFSLDVKVETVLDQRYKIVSQGQLRISLDHIEYLSHDAYQFNISTSLIRYVPFDAGRNFQIYLNNQLYQFIPSHNYLSTKATIIIEELYKLKHPNQS